MEIRKIDTADKPIYERSKEVSGKQRTKDEFEIPVIKPPGLQQPG